MLDIIRQHSQSWGVKLLFGLIVLVFVFWGVGSFTNNSANILAKVNDRTITIQDFLQEYEKRLETLRQQRPNLTSEDIRAMQFKKQVFDAMINQELILQLAQKEGITVSDVELRDAIMHMPVFLNEAQQFDKDRYQSLLQANRMTPAQFEAGFAQDLKTRKVQEYLTLAGTVSEQEARDFFLFAREQARMDYILFDQNEYLDQVKPSEEQITAYYNAHKDDFAIPAKIKIDYLRLTPETLAPREDVDETAIADYYASHPGEFMQEEQIKARHILIKVDENAPAKEVARAKKKIEDIRARYDKGTPFAQLAATYSQGPSRVQGGDLGWFPRGRMVPAFEEAAFALKKGEVSQPVKTAFGFHLIQVEDRKPAGKSPLETVHDDIRVKLAQEQAADSIQDVLDQALELIITGEDLDQVSETLGIDVQTTDFFTQATGPTGLKLSDEAVGTLFGLMQDETTQAPILLEDGYLLAKKVAEEPAHTLELDKAKPRIIAALKQEGAKAIALEKAKQALADLLAHPHKDMGHKVQTSESFGRQGFIPGLGMNPELVEKVFATTDTTWLDTTFPVTNGVVLARLNQRIKPDTDAWDKEASYWTMTLEQARKQELFTALLNSLRAKATIAIMNEKVLED
jgi:peptidyl-prolyl cis-trans isomerase D